jgi:hypothetical protein
VPAGGAWSRDAAASEPALVAEQTLCPGPALHHMLARVRVQPCRLDRIHSRRLGEHLRRREREGRAIGVGRDWQGKAPSDRRSRLADERSNVPRSQPCSDRRGGGAQNCGVADGA